MSFESISYNRHKTHYSNSFDEDKSNSWKRKDTTDYWRHERMYSCLNPLIDRDTNAKWLTVGDGRYGTDANYLESRGSESVLASDIASTHLEMAKAEGFISNYAIENAEKLSFGDESFDMVLCKESYHHFPRPMVALYEMLRVARHGVVLIEPVDPNIICTSDFGLLSTAKWGFQALKNRMKSVIGKEVYYNYGGYETVGNYKYTISEREIEKVALGMNLETVSFKYMNDHYEEGGEFEIRSDNAPIFNKIKKAIEQSDKHARLGLRQGGILVAVIHKTTPDPDLIRDLEELDFKNKKLSRNPYV